MRETPPPASPNFEEWQKGKRFKSSLVLCQLLSAMPSVTTLIPKSSQRFSQSCPVKTSPNENGRPTSSGPDGPALNRLTRSENGSMTTSSTDGSRSSATTSPSVGKSHQDFTVPLRNQGDRSYKNSGRLCSLPILAPTSLSSSVTWTLSMRSSRGPTRFALPSSTKTPGSRLACR